MIDDATNHLRARFVEHDATDEKPAAIATYLEGHGRRPSFYADRATLSTIPLKTKRGKVGG